jgi:REP element-mobilizing transposase RayT
MCRGDRREEIFFDDEDRKLFLKTLGEACVRNAWVVHCYVLMGNHYHLLLETRAGGLSRGMQWLQTTYTARFNARHKVSGHLFQGRFKAVPMDPEEDDYWDRLGDYIHLNPARAGLIPQENPLLEGYGWSSYPGMISGKKIPAWLETGRVIGSRGWDWQKRSGRQAYRGYLQERCEEVLAERRRSRRKRGGRDEWADLRRGWYVGGSEFKEKLMGMIEIAVGKGRPDSFGGREMVERGERYAEELLGKCVTELGIEIEELRTLRKNEVRKQTVAWLLRTQTGVKNEWIQRRIGMGHRNNISRAVFAVEEGKDRKLTTMAMKIVQCAD